MSLAAEKKRLRDAIGLLRRAQGPDEAAARSLKITEAVALLPEFSRSRKVGCYISIRGEVQTGALIRRCWDAGIGVYVPVYRAEQEGGGYVFCECPKGADMRPGLMGIPEPRGTAIVEAVELDLIIVPGVAFDGHGGRLGRGAGYYDRMLASAGAACKAGVCFGFQLVGDVPVDNRDIRMNMVVTENGVVRAGALIAGGE